MLYSFTEQRICFKLYGHMKQKGCNLVVPKGHELYVTVNL